MAEGLLLCVAEEMLTNLASKALDEVASTWGFKYRLEKLKVTINTIKNVQLDAEERPADSHAIRGCLERLATAVYEADDLFDKFATLASQKQLMGGNKVIKEVHTFFSPSNQIAFAFSISQKIKAIREMLDDIVKDKEFATFLSQTRWEGNVIKTTLLKEESPSYVAESLVIGREGDKKAILDILASNELENEVLHVVPIVGIGGQGKTTLAQLVYNDSWVKENFELRLWVHVSMVFDSKKIIEKILKSRTNAETPLLETNHTLGRLQNKIGDKKYLLVLDDVWNEIHDEWIKLEGLLKIGRKGSKILVTTRSREVANIMGSVPLHELRGLSEEDSWLLFQEMASLKREHENSDLKIEVGKEIVKKCANVPLAIRAVSSLLYGKDESKWLLLKNRSLPNILDAPDGVMNILKLSYLQLPSPLKNCFAYCALFPKGYQFEKETLIDLWMAEGFIIPSNHGSQGLEEVADEYFYLLFQGCFFQDITKDEWGDIKSCKMNDLMHDLALTVAGVKCQVAKYNNDISSDKGIHHLSFAYQLNSTWTIPSWMLDLKLLRTFLLPEQMNDGSYFTKSIIQKVISSFRCLRVLDLHATGVQSLPSSVGKLIHLRYLNLSQTPIKELPDSITKLQNLQTLKVYNCLTLGALPESMRKLNNLRSLDVGECINLIHMPLGLGELNSLAKLPRFIVNNIHSPRNKDKPKFAKLSDLKTLNNLRGRLHIGIVGEIRKPLEEASEAKLYDKRGLRALHIEFDLSLTDDGSHDEAVLEGLRPDGYLKNLEICGYRGHKFPGWVKNNLAYTLPDLTEVELAVCENCQQVPSFAQLPTLKRLRLVSLKSVEYMEIDSGLDELSALFFVSLEELTLVNMDKLEGWWKVGTNVNDAGKEASQQLTEQCHLNKSFSKLSKLMIDRCPKLKFLPLCPNVEELTLLDGNKAMSVSRMATYSASTSNSNPGSKLKMLKIRYVEDLIYLPRECLHQLCQLQLWHSNLVSTDGIGMNEVFKSMSSSLRTLEFTFCNNLRNLGQGMEHLTVLEKLKLWVCEELDVLQNEELPWKYIKNLRHLEFHNMPKLVSLPSGLQHLANLQSLEITYCVELKELPKWTSCFSSLRFLKLDTCPKLISLPDGFSKLKSLDQLIILGCPGLTERCRQPNGSDWSKILHIPFVQVQ